MGENGSVDGKGPSFALRELRKQTAYFAANFPGQTGYKDTAYRLRLGARGSNLAPAIRNLAEKYFIAKRIAWHTHANHALSSQVCCLNFLMPLAESPALLSRVIGEALSIAAPEMLQIEEGPDGRPLFIGFEWNGRHDYLNEGDEQGRRTRGSNSTSADAVVRFHLAGVTETVLIEWKYTESYGSPIPPAGNQTRIERYRNLAFAPNGPILNDRGLRLESFFYEPFYQLLRQQMLAFQMQKKMEDGADRVRVLHIAPAGNLRLAKVTSPALTDFGSNAFVVFRSLLTPPESFISRSTEGLFGPIISELKDSSDWAAYIASRYDFVANLTEIATGS